MNAELQYEAGIQDVLRIEGDGDDEFIPPRESAISTIRELIAQLDGEDCPSFSFSTMGDGGIRMHSGDPEGRHFVVDVSPNEEADGSNMMYMFFRGDGIRGTIMDVTVEELRKRFDWVEGR